MYNTILPLITRDITITGSLTKKLKVHRHNLKYEMINGAKCRTLIDELLEIFEVIIGAQLEDRKTVVAKRNKVSFSKRNTDEQIEQYLLQKLFDESLNNASNKISITHINL